MILVCPLCADADDVERTPLGPGIWSYTCSRSRKHPSSMPYAWEGTAREAIRPDGIGLPGFDPRPGPDRQTGYSTSVHLAHTLSRLSRRTEICLRTGPATGPWKTASTISYWALPPAPPSESRLTYQTFTERYPLSRAA